VGRLPFAALPSGKGGHLVEERAFATVPVPQMLPRLAAPVAPGASPSMLLVGDVDFGAPAAADRRARPWRGEALARRGPWRSPGCGHAR